MKLDLKNAGSLERVVRLLLCYANETPELLSLLYDMDLMPEQLKERTHDWVRMLMLIEAWKNRTQWPNDPSSPTPPSKASDCQQERD